MVSPLLNQPSPPPTNPIFSKPTSSKPLIIWTKPELQKAVKSLEDESIRTATSGSHQALYGRLISGCIRHKATDEGDRLRAHMARAGFRPTVFLNNQFINLYSKCGAPHRARQVFDAMPERNIVSWNAMIAGYCGNELCADALDLLKEMMEDGAAPDCLTYLSALRASASSGDRRAGEQVHALVIKNGFFCSWIQIGNALINFYSKMGALGDAEAVFDGMAGRDGVTWNSIIAANSRDGSCDRAVALLVKMQEEDEVADEFTYGSLLAMDDTSYAEKLHSQIMKKGLGSNVFVSSALLDAYGRHGNPQDARRVFNSMTEKNAASWNAAISACVFAEAVGEGIQLFIQMLESEAIPDNYTVSILLKAAITHLSIFTAKQLHGLAFKMGLWQDTAVGNTLIILYGIMDMIEESMQSFADISDPDLISWNSMIQAYIDGKEFEQALKFFIEMKNFCFNPDRFTFVSAMAASAALPCYKTGRQIHCSLIKSGLVVDDFTGSSLIDMYAKSMAAEDAKKVFEGMKKKDLITWNSMIAGFAQNGYLDEVLTLLKQMKEEGIQPDNFTFASILSACANATAIEQGKQIHAQIMKSDLDVDTALTNALITLYCRSGITNDAERVFSSIHDKTVVSWTSMISGYAQSGYSEKALKLFDQMEVENAMPNAKTFIALLTACSHGGRSDAAVRYFGAMEEKYGIKPGFDHYACLVDILGRAGRLEEAEGVIEGMPYTANALVWRMLLSGCRIHGDLGRGERSMGKIVGLEPGDSAAFVLLSNLYAALGFHERAGKVRRMMREKGVKKEAGRSWIEVKNRVYGFVAGDISHSRTQEIYSQLKILLKHMRDEGYDPGNAILR